MNENKVRDILREKVKDIIDEMRDDSEFSLSQKGVSITDNTGVYKGMITALITEKYIPDIALRIIAKQRVEETLDRANELTKEFSVEDRYVYMITICSIMMRGFSNKEDYDKVFEMVHYAETILMKEEIDKLRNQIQDTKQKEDKLENPNEDGTFYVIAKTITDGNENTKLLFNNTSYWVNEINENCKFYDEHSAYMEFLNVISKSVNRKAKIRLIQMNDNNDKMTVINSSYVEGNIKRAMLEEPKKSYVNYVNLNGSNVLAGSDKLEQQLMKTDEERIKSFIDAESGRKALIIDKVIGGTDRGYATLRNHLFIHQTEFLKMIKDGSSKNIPCRTIVELYVGGRKTEWVVIGKDHDNTTGTIDLMPRYQFDSQSLNYIGCFCFGTTSIYKDSMLDKYLNLEFIKSFDFEIRNLLKPMLVESYSLSDNKSIVTPRKIKLPSMKELGFDINPTPTNIKEEGMRYEVFENGRGLDAYNRFIGFNRNVEDGYGTPNWTRSSNTFADGYVWVVRPNGTHTSVESTTENLGCTPIIRF